MKSPSPSPQQTFEALSEAGNAFQKASRRLEEAQQLRDAAIIASSEQGFSRRKVAAAAGVSVGRVQQVLGMDVGARRNLADRVLEIAVKRLPKRDQDRYSEEWHALLAEFDAPMTKLSVALSLLRGGSRLGRELKAREDEDPTARGKK
jgi:hypothetical protein